jgi:BirA family biotin operon repressor/biotin-[acetyl-CoA-carboxylase] ligase
MDSTEIKTVLSHLPLGDLRFFPTLDSTNSEAARWANQGAPNLSVVVADEQTAGRGRFSRRWFTQPGSALAFTVILRPHEKIPVLGHYTALGALAVCDAVHAGYNLPALIKWSNDVLIYERKTAGVLVEVSWNGDSLDSILIGVGVNVTQSSLPADKILDYPATYLEKEAGQPVNRSLLLQQILTAFLERWAEIGSQRFLDAWESRLAWVGEWVQVIGLPGKEALTGKLLGLDADGCLLLQDASADIHHVAAGDVHLRRFD